MCTLFPCCHYDNHFSHSIWIILCNIFQMLKPSCLILELAKDETLLETPKYKSKQEPYIALCFSMLYILLAFFFIWILDDGKIDLHLAILLPIVGIPFSLTKVFTHSLFEFPLWKTYFTTNMNLYLQGDVGYTERRQQKFEKHIANKILQRDERSLRKTRHLISSRSFDRGSKF